MPHRLRKKIYIKEIVNKEHFLIIIETFKFRFKFQIKLFVSTFNFNENYGTKLGVVMKIYSLQEVAVV